MTLPASFLAARKPIATPIAWTGDQFGRPAEWALRLDPGHLAELESACASVRKRGLDLRDITRADFPLPRLGPELEAMRALLHDGPGFALLKGISVAQFGRADLRRIFVGMGTHLGIPVSQSYRGDYLGEVKDYREPGNERPYRRGGAINMHRDPCDIVGLLCYQPAASGGLSRVTSAAAVWNAFLAERPHLLAPLLDGFRLYITKDDRHSELPVTPMKIPVFTQDPDGQLHCTFIAELAEWAVEKGGEGWAPGAVEAIAFFREVANREGVFLDMEIEQGDIQFLNNRTTIHGRTDYTDWPDPERTRTMFRLWLMCPDWPQPATAVNRVLFGKTDRADGGVHIRPTAVAA